MREIIYFEGLNCYLGCIVNGASLLDIHYEAALSSLWSETNFTYAPKSGTYFTKKMLANLHTLGLKIEKFSCPSAVDTAQYLATFSIGEWMIVGMDAFYIPTNPFYQTLHGVHYFLASKKQDGSLMYVDPTYNITDLNMISEDIAAHAFEIYRLSKGSTNYYLVDIVTEAQEVISSLTHTHQAITTEIHTNIGNKQKEKQLLARYVEAMINNRYLYAHYLQTLPVTNTHELFFQPEFYKRWNSVKNGLYKISLMSHPEDVIDQVCDMLNQLVVDEMTMANSILENNQEVFL